MRIRHRIPSVFSLSMVDVMCCALGCVILLWLLNLKKAKENEELSGVKLDAAQKTLDDQEAALAKRAARILYLESKERHTAALASQQQRDADARIAAADERAKRADERAAEANEKAAKTKDEAEKAVAAAKKERDDADVRVVAANERVKKADERSAEANDKVAKTKEEAEKAAAAAKKVREDADGRTAAADERVKKANERAAEATEQAAKAKEEVARALAAAKKETDDVKGRIAAADERVKKANERAATADEQAAKAKEEVEKRFAGLALSGKRVIFLVDMSGSMELIDEKTPSPEKWPVVRKSLVKVMTSLPELKQFQVIVFSKETRFLLGKQGEWIDYNEKTSVKEVEDALAATKPAGGTNMYAALDAAFRYRAFGLDTIYLLSDGLPNMGEGVPQDEAERLLRANREPELSGRLSMHIRTQLRTTWNRTTDKERVRINSIGFFYESPDVGAFLWALSRENEGSFVGMSKP